jgi:hypothetical protein
VKAKSDDNSKRHIQGCNYRVIPEQLAAKWKEPRGAACGAEIGADLPCRYKSDRGAKAGSLGVILPAEELPPISCEARRNEIDQNPDTHMAHLIGHPHVGIGRSALHFFSINIGFELFQ